MRAPEIRSRWRAASVLALIALTLSACSSGGTASPSAQASTPAASTPASAAASASAAAAPVTLEWWHITTADPGKADWQAMADAYTAAHPNVKINISVIENEAFKTKLQTTAQ